MKRPLPFGKYLLLERISVGGMAEVFCAKAFGVEGFERILAIKKILPSMVEDEEFIQMFIDEARISVLLNHANVVQIHELGQHEENYYIAMEYVAGRDLRTILERYRRRKEIMPTAQAVFIASRICEGLDYAHRKKDARGGDLNIVHRDVSPQNILVSYEGEVKIIDFGIAKAANRAQKTQAGILKGKFGYMSPEQVRGLPIDRRSDVFALGVIVYEMLTGERLFIGESDFSTLEKVRNAEVVPPREYNSNIPVALEKVVLKTLAREAEERYQWAGDLEESLMRFLLAGDVIYNAKHLSVFMKEAFAEDLLREQERMERFAQVQRPDQIEASGVTVAPPKKRPGAPPDARTDPSATGVGDQALPPLDEAPGSESTEIFNPNAPDQAVAQARSADRPTSYDKIPSADPAMARRPSRRISSVRVSPAATAIDASEAGAAAGNGADNAPDGDEPGARPITVAPTVIGVRSISGPQPAASDAADEYDGAADGGDGGLEAEDTVPPAGATVVAPSRPRRGNGAAADVPGSRMAPVAMVGARGGGVASLFEKPFIYYVAGGMALFVILVVASVVLLLRKPKPAVLHLRPNPPTAQVTVDDHRVTSDRVAVMPGRHAVTMRADGYVPVTQYFQPEAGQVVEVAIALTPVPRPPPEEPATPAPPTPPPPAPAPEAPAGATTKASTPTSPPVVATTTPDKAPNRPVASSPTPAPTPKAVRKFTVEFASEPEGADVSIAGKTVKAPGTVELDAAKGYTARFSLKGYKAESKPVKDDGSGRVTVFAELAKLTVPPPRSGKGRCAGTLITASNPVAEVFIDGKSTGRWTPIPPASPLELDAAEHTIAYKASDGRQAVRRGVRIDCGKPTKIVGVSDFK